MKRFLHALAALLALACAPAALAQSTIPAHSVDVSGTRLDTVLLGKAALASPTLTGDPKAPTPTTSDNDTSIATTAYVRSAISTYASGGTGGITALTGDVTASGTGSVAAALASSGVSAGSYGSSSAVPVLTIDAKGRVTAATTAAISGGSGITALTGDVTASGTGSVAASLASTAVSAGSYGSTTLTAGTAPVVPYFTVDAKGRLTAAAGLTIGNAASYSVGTSGANVPLLSTTNTWSLSQSFSGTAETIKFSATQLRFIETDQADPAGNFDLYGNGDAFGLYRSTGAGFASQSYVWNVGVGSYVVDFAQTPTVASTPVATFRSSTWTPAFSFVTAGTSSFSGVTSSGNWRRVGDLVTVDFTITGTVTTGTASGFFRVGVLPFGSIDANMATGSVRGLGTCFTWPTGATSVSIGILGTSYIGISALGSGVAATSLSASNIAGGSCTVTGEITYLTGDA